MKWGGDNFVKNILRVNPMRTVCEVLREIFWHTDDPVIRAKVLEAIGMAKKMDKKLRGYSEYYDDEMWEKLDNVEEVKLERMRKFEEENK